MKWTVKITALLLCVLLLCAPARGEETVIEPSYPQPEWMGQLLEIARAELGYTEESGGRTKYGVWSGEPEAEWCAEYLCWCVNRMDKQYGTKILNTVYPNYTGNNTGRDWFIRQGRYIARKGTVPGWGSQWYLGDTVPMQSNSYIPQPGDWIFFSDNSLGNTSHVAMTEYCSVDENGKITIHVLEGNHPDRVQRGEYALDYWAIQGYGMPRDIAGIVMKSGNEGEKVKALQQRLVQAGYLDGQYVTGKYAALTQSAVKRLQADLGFYQTGIADMQTQLSLEEKVSALADRSEPEGY